MGSQVAGNLDAKVIESYERLGQWNALQIAADNIALYLQGKRDGGRLYRFRMNLVQGVCIANAAIQVGDEPQIELLPRETGEKPQCFINTNIPLPRTMHTEGSEMSQLFAALRPETYDPNAPGFLAPLTDAEAALVKQAVTRSEQLRLQAMAAGEPEPLDLLPSEFYVELDESTIAAAKQELLDLKLNEGGFTQALIENVLYNNIFGWQCLLPEFDAETQQPIFSNPYFSTVHLDPLKTDIKRCQWAVIDEYLDADEAKMLWPKLSRQIDEHSSLGPPVAPGTMPYLTPMPWFQSLMGRKVVIVRNAWIRNQEFPVGPMQAEEALQAGLIDQLEVPYESVYKSTAGGGVLGVSPSQDGGSPEIDVPAGDRSGSIDESGDSGASGEYAGDVEAAGAEPQTRVSYRLKGQSEEITPDHPSWPQRTVRALREIRVIASQLVEDRMSKRVDIPLGHNVNIPIPYTPYGQGEPDRLEPLQRAYNATLTDIIEHGDAVTYAPKLVSRELAQDNPELLRIGLNDPRKFYPVDSKILAQGVDKIMGAYKPPDLPSDTWRREQILFQKFQYESDQSSVLRGQTEGDTAMSGNAIMALQNAAKTAIDFKGMRLRQMVEHVVRVVDGDLMEYMTPEDCAAVVRKYPKEIWQYLHPRAKQLKYAVAIKIGKKNNHAQTIVNAANTPVGQQTISPQSFLEALDMDPEMQQNNRRKWMEREAAMQSASMAQKPQMGGAGEYADAGGREVHSPPSGPQQA